MGKFDINDIDYNTHPIYVRLNDKEGFVKLQKDELDAPKTGEGLKVVLLMDDPNRQKESVDMAVIGPELVKPIAQLVTAKYWVDFSAAKAAAAGWGVRKLPAMAFFKGEVFIGALEGLQNWDEYIKTLSEIIQRDKAPARQIMIMNKNASEGGCHH